jgi:hypothetical protein
MQPFGLPKFRTAWEAFFGDLPADERLSSDAMEKFINAHGKKGIPHDFFTAQRALHKTETEVIAVLADYEHVAPLLALHSKGELSWKQLFDRLEGNTQVRLTQAEAQALAKNGFAVWSGTNRMIITARCEPFAKLSDLSARIGFDRNGNRVVREGAIAGNRREVVVISESRRDWIGPFLRSQFLKREGSKEELKCVMN